MTSHRIAAAPHRPATKSPISDDGRSRTFNPALGRKGEGAAAAAAPSLGICLPGPGPGGVQAARIARTRGVSEEQVLSVIRSNVESRTLGLFGEPRVNVLRTNLALDLASRKTIRP